MMPDFIFNVFTKLRIHILRAFGSKIQKLVIRIADEYYYNLSKGMVHEESISKIIHSEYNNEKVKYDECRYFVFNRKQSIDSIFDSKYGKSGRFMSNLFKLMQKIYLDKLLDDNRKSQSDELNYSALEINKIFNKVVLYSFEKYNG